jgi:ferric-dicitrate binding protein FerR (iron transport regulator)
MTTERKSDPVAEAVATLIHAAGHREDPPPEAYGIVLAAAEEAFHGLVRRRRRWRIATALAATVVVAAAVAGLLRALPPTDTTASVARIARVVGEADLQAPGGPDWARVTSLAAALQAGARLRTGEHGAAAVTLAGGTSLRLAPMTEAEFGDDARVRLRHGAIYVDTGSGDGRTISVITPAGTARDFGTQFEVRYEHERLQVRVREGRVALLRDSGQIVADSGTQLAVSASGDVSRTVIARAGPDWQWVESIAPTPDFDDRPVNALLEWAARETGCTLRYANAGVERQAASTILHGKVGEMAPLEVLDTLLLTTDLTYVLVEDGTIEVRHK